MVPFWPPRSIIMRISSSVTVSSSASTFRRSSFSMPLVETDSSQITGRITVATAFTTPLVKHATWKDFCMAIRLGTSSPNTREK